MHIKLKIIYVLIMEDHEKLAKILEIRKRRESKALKKHQNKRRELDAHEQQLQDDRRKIEEFMQKRTVELHTLQNRIKTEPVTGHVIEQYLMLKDDTQKQIEDMYEKLEEKSQAYYPIMDEVNEFFNEWQDTRRSNSKLEQTVEQKTEEFIFEKEQEAEKKLLDDFVFRPK